MKRILVTHATLSGSTVEVAEAVAKVLSSKGYTVVTAPIDAAADLEGYDGVVIGAPMILGWHRGALRFLRKNRQSLERIPLAVFITAMSLTDTGISSVSGVPVYIDDRLSKKPISAGRLSLRERYATAPNYTRPILKAVTPIKPVGMAIFGGQLIYGRLKWWAFLFAILIVRAQAGDHRNWEAIQAWAAKLPEMMSLEN